MIDCFDPTVETTSELNQTPGERAANYVIQFIWLLKLTVLVKLYVYFITSPYMHVQQFFKLVKMSKFEIVILILFTIFFRASKQGF